MARALLVLLALVAAGGCGARPPRIDAAHAALLAGWVEDTARGRLRDPDELLTEGGGDGFANAAAWVRGDEIGRRHQPPAQIRTRLARWPELARALADGRVVTVPGTGLVAPRPGLPTAVRAAAEDLADGENLDRRTIDGIVERLSGDREQGFRAAVAALRDREDAAAGGREWRRPPATDR